MVGMVMEGWRYELGGLLLKWTATLMLGRQFYIKYLSAGAATIESKPKHRSYMLTAEQ